MKINSLQSRILLSIAAIVSISLAILSIAIGISAKKELYTSLENNALNLLNATKNQVESHYNSINYYKEAMVNM